MGGSRPAYSLSFNKTTSKRNMKGGVNTPAAFSTLKDFGSRPLPEGLVGDGTDDKPGAYTESGSFHSPVLGPCFSKLVVTPTPRGFKVEVLIHQQQKRNFSQSSEGDKMSDGNNSVHPRDFAKDSEGGDAVKGTESDEVFKNKERQQRERRKRYSVLYPYNEQDIRRKQAKRKDQARARTVANVNRALLGNVVIAGSKLFAWFCSQSSSMMSEFIHSVVDCANQYLLLQGLRDSSNDADRRHPYGYGKSVYFWALVSALGTFFMGFGVSMSHAWGELMNPSLHEIGPEVWGVLGFSFLVDGYVLTKTIKEINEEVPKGQTFFGHLKTMRDPAILAILLEDGAACIGVLLAITGTACSHATGNPLYDGAAGIGISCLLGSMGVILARVNHRFLLGQAVDKETTDGIEKILRSRKSIDAVHSVQSQWTGPDTFSYKAEVGFDGTFLAAKLMPTHEKEFFAIRDSMKTELPLVLSWYAEDVIRTVEREVRIIEAQIRKKYPAAEFIELEPMSKDFDQYAIDDSFEQDLRKLESETLENLRQLIPSLDQIDEMSKTSNPSSAVDEKQAAATPKEESTGASKTI